jgi:hypothetical protein
MDKTKYEDQLNPRSCSTCLYMDRMVLPDLSTLCACRRRPGQVIGTFIQSPNGPQPIHATCWMTVDPMRDWCGDHELKMATTN